MRRISSSLTWWHKKGFPAFWFGFLALFTVIWIPGIFLQQVPAPTLLVPVGMAVFGYLLMRWLVFPLLDEVWLEGDQIVVRNRGEEDRFPIANIINVQAELFVNPERIVLMLKEPCKFGREIVFSPPFRWWHLRRHPLADELMRRVHHIDDDKEWTAPQ